MTPGFEAAIHATTDALALGYGAGVAFVVLIIVVGHAKKGD